MTREGTVKARVGGLRRLLARLNANRGELQHLEASRSTFESLLGRIEEAADRQAFHTASKQEASQQLQGFLVEGERLATVLQLAVKQHYGAATTSREVAAARDRLLSARARVAGTRAYLRQLLSVRSQLLEKLPLHELVLSAHELV